MMVVYLLVSQLLPQVGHHVAQLGGADEAVAVLVKHPEGFSDLLLARKKCCVRI